MGIEFVSIPNGWIASTTDDAAAVGHRRMLGADLPNGTDVSVLLGQCTPPFDRNPVCGVSRTERNLLSIRLPVHFVPDQCLPEDVGAQRKAQRPIQVPVGKLAAGFYWYEREPDLLKDEQTAMAHYFPNFKLEVLPDGRLSWIGSVLRPIAESRQDCWHLQLIYDHNHPHNDTYGGSVKVYSILPDIDDLYAKLPGMAHLLRDKNDKLYICTARPEDIRTNWNEGSDSAATALGRAVKWITVFELWVDGVVSTAEFQSHSLF